MTKAKDLLMILALVLSSVTGFKFKYDKDGIEVELQRTQQRLAEAEKAQAEFSLAGVCD